MTAPHNPRNAGDLDPDFGDAGLAPFPAGLQDGHSRLLSDGRILSACTDSVSARITVLRHLQNGTLDPSFGEQGVTHIDMPDAQVAAYTRMLVLPDDSALVYGPVGSGGSHHSFVCRILPDGALDSAFGVAGFCILDFGHQTDLVSEIVRLDDGKITALVSGPGADGLHDVYLARLVNGHLDPSFGENGEGYVRVSRLVTLHFALTASGGYVLTPWTDFSTATFRQYLADGSLDRAFGENGQVTVPLPSPTGNARFNQVTVQADGKILAVGRANVGFGPHTLTVRLNPDGSMDNTFNNGEAKIMVFQGYQTSNTDVATLPDGTMVAAGNIEARPSDVTLMRLQPNGNLDMSFGSNGLVISDLGGDEKCNGMEVQRDGRILVSGTRTLEGAPHRMFLARYLG
ncbi:hypothetical protein ACIP1T_24890 [Pseudomonas japonica]|uniref:hypothetical protein n=1 Tax=Pseudomonas japonica TaxID=256466 RepID=UPI0037FC60FC